MAHGAGGGERGGGGGNTIIQTSESRHVEAYRIASLIKRCRTQLTDLEVIQIQYIDAFLSPPPLCNLLQNIHTVHVCACDPLYCTVHHIRSKFLSLIIKKLPLHMLA